jgi:hypothetical protein
MTTTLIHRSRWLLMAFAMLCIAVPAAAQPTITINGTLGSGSPDYPSTSGTMTGRLNRFLPATTCAAPESCPGYLSTADARTYDEYRFTNCGTAPICIQFDLFSWCSGTDFIFGVAYLNTFDPSNLCTNYLGDGGESAAGYNATTQVTIPAGSTAVYIVHNVTPGGAASCAYTVTVSGFEVGTTDASRPGATSTSVVMTANGIMQTVSFPICSAMNGSFVSATSSDPDAGTFTTDQPDDIQGDAPGVSSVDLRMEKSPGNDGRIYTLNFEREMLKIVVPKSTGSYRLGGSNTCMLALDRSQVTLDGPSITIPFNLGSAANVTIGIYTMAGKEVARVANEQAFAAGANSVSWDGTYTYGRTAGANVPDGTYIVVATACGFTEAQPLTVDR